MSWYEVCSLSNLYSFATAVRKAVITSNIIVFDDSERLRGFLFEKIALRKKRIHPEHSRRFNHDMQLEIDCYEWVLGKIEVNKIHFDRLEGIIRATIKDLEKRKDKAMVRTETDNLWTKIESLQWVLFVLFAIRNGKMVIV
jgi:hypothetical protein